MLTVCKQEETDLSDNNAMGNFFGLNIGDHDATDMNLGKLWEMLTDREAWRTVAHGVVKSWTRLGDWTTTTGDERLKTLCQYEGMMTAHGSDGFFR